MDKNDVKALWIVPAMGVLLVGTILLFQKLSQIEVTDEGISFGKDKSSKK